ncbi:hypothetical protein [Clavibacter michiganensis]|uniref:hypothetical protein n=1 Tax=Clavibacter michiganensis TaxID=28447 RepID=UPI001D0AA610|nr:hypothetical protein [Clavibacter michiganensis]UDM19786.1 hypothetical protein LHJ47_11955 [Clavibacter michiganensis subsp. michiganensis]
MEDLPSNRAVMPWWYVAGAALALLVALVLVPVANLGLVLPMWGALVGTTIRDRRRGAEPMTTSQEALVSAVLTPLLLGIAALASQLWPFQQGASDARVLVGGAVGLAVGGALLLVLRIRGVLRRRRARGT